MVRCAVILAALPLAATWSHVPITRVRGTSRARTATMAAPTFIFEMADDRSSIKFGCRQQSLTMVKPEAGGSLHEFIGSSSDTIVMSSWAPGQVTPVEGTTDEFLIAVEEFNFVALKFAVELRARCSLDEGTTTARLNSLGFKLIGPGLERVAEAIDVTVSGALRPSPPDARICALSGDVSFVASGALPGVLRAAPEPAIRAAARAMSETLIGAAQERFGERVPKAYAKWAQARAASRVA